MARSEFFAQGISANHRGMVVGEESMGKATEMSYVKAKDFPYGFSLVTGRYYDVKGQNLG